MAAHGELSGGDGLPPEVGREQRVALLQAGDDLAVDPHPGVEPRRRRRRRRLPSARREPHADRPTDHHPYVADIGAADARGALRRQLHEVAQGRLREVAAGDAVGLVPGDREAHERPERAAGIDGDVDVPQRTILVVLGQVAEHGDIRGTGHRGERMGGGWPNRPGVARTVVQPEEVHQVVETEHRPLRHGGARPHWVLPPLADQAGQIGVPGHQVRAARPPARPLLRSTRAAAGRGAHRPGGAGEPPQAALARCPRPNGTAAAPSARSARRAEPSWAR